MMKKNKNAQQLSIKAAFSSKASKAGGFSLAVSAVVLVIIIVANLIISALPSEYTSFDLTLDDTFSVSSQTVDYLSTVDSDITVYHVCQEGNEDSYITNLIEQYDELSDKITVKAVDPVVNPAFTSKYTDEELTDNSLIVVNGERSKCVSYNDMYDYQMDYSSYSYQTTAFKGENALTNAIDYVTNDNLPLVYFVTGHGEAELEASFASALSSANYLTEKFSLLGSEGIPEEADCVAIISPASDFSENDVKLLEDYIANSGKIFLTTDNVTKESHPNLYSFIEYYGILPVDGTVVETDTSMCYMYYTFLLPDFGTHEIMSGMENYDVLLPGTQAATLAEEKRDGVSVYTLLSSSDKAYSAVDFEAKESLEAGENDIPAPELGFGLGFAATDSSVNADAPGMLVYFPSSTFMSAEYDVTGANSMVFVNSFGWLTEKEASLSIPAKSMQIESLTVDEASANILQILFIFIIPAILLVAGFVIFIKRRKR